jgi:transcriptional regulator with XRE-family HTH domain
MSATAAVLDVSRPFRRERALHPAAFAEHVATLGEHETPTGDPRNLALQLRSALKQAGLTMSQVSAESRMRFGEKSPYFIPATFLYKQKIGITPHLCQVVALSEITGYRFADWMKLCGFDLRLILALQLKIPNERTTMVSARHLSSLVYPSFEREHSAARRDHDRFYYAKIGSRDAVVYPRLHPGSIVRADRFFCAQILESSSAHDHLWLVEHPGGLTCCHVNPVGNQQVVLLPNRPPLSPWPLRLSTQARILGLVDGELCAQETKQNDGMVRHATLQLYPVSSNFISAVSLSRLIRTSRLRTGLTFREAHKMTQRIARFMGNADFGIAAGLLSDYEAMNKLPRHIAKIISLCVIYGIDVVELLKASRIHIDDSRKRPLITRERFPNQSVPSPSNHNTESATNWA